MRLVIHAIEGDKQGAFLKHFGRDLKIDPVIGHRPAQWRAVMRNIYVFPFP